MSRWAKIRGPFAVLAAATLLGTAVIGPLTVPSGQANADEMAFQARIHQQFVPNVSAEDDFVYVDMPVAMSAEEKERIATEKAEKAAAAAAKKAAEKAESDTDNAGDSGDSGSSTPSAPPKYTGGGSPAEWMAAAGIAESDWGYVDFIASSESGWNPNATNASSGACGLIQALPCSKVPGSGYDPVDNLTWAKGYATDRYGSWKQAYEFWTANHWW